MALFCIIVTLVLLQYLQMIPFQCLRRSPGKITSITVPTFEALTQFGTATITTKNIGEMEASYSLTVFLLNLYLSYIS